MGTSALMVANLRRGTAWLLTRRFWDVVRTANVRGLVYKEQITSDGPGDVELYAVVVLILYLPSRS